MKILAKNFQHRKDLDQAVFTLVGDGQKIECIEGKEEELKELMLNETSVVHGIKVRFIKPVITKLKKKK